MIGPGLPPKPSIPAVRIADDELRQVGEYYVPPRSYADAKQRLTQWGVVILTGSAGYGKRTTALSLLLDQLADGGRLLELVPDWTQPDPVRLPADHQRGYLLDLAGSGSQVLRPLVQGLRRRHAKTLMGRQSCLVVTASSEQCEDSRGVFGEVMVPMTDPPPAHSVIDRRLDGHARQWLKDSLADPRLSGLRDDIRLPADAVRFAAAVSRAAGMGRPGIDQVLDECSQWRQHLKEWFNSNTGEYMRVLLVAAALINGCKVDELFVTTRAIQTAIPGRRLLAGPLEGLTRSERLALIDAEVDGEGRVFITTRRPGLERAVIDYVLDEHPMLRDSLWRWVTGPAFATTTLDIRSRVARAIVGRSTSYGRPVFREKLPELVRTGGVHRGLATTLLKETVLDPVIGPAMRRQLTAWAESPTTSEALVEAVAAISSGVFGERFPVLALETLRGILQRADPPAAAFDGLTRLASHGDNRRPVLDAVVRWMDSPANRRAAGVAFVELMRPGPDSVAFRLLKDACSDAGVLCLLLAGWRELRECGLPEADIAELVERWADAVDSGSVRQGVAVDLLMLAIESDLKRVAARSLGLGVVDPGGVRMATVRRVLALRQ